MIMLRKWGPLGYLGGKVNLRHTVREALILKAFLPMCHARFKKTLTQGNCNLMQKIDN